MRPVRRKSRWTLGLLSLATLLAGGAACSGVEAAPEGMGTPAEEDTVRAFPGAMGWAATTRGGRGGRIIRVTTLAAAGPGSFREAVEAEGPRIVVFEVGGVIDLDRQDIRITEPFLTIAGQTAPSPGITFIRGGFGIRTHDVVIQHIRIRPGEAGEAKLSGFEVDGLSTTSAYNVIVDHCSISWATDENLSASGPRFEGATLEEWRKNTSRRITFSNNIIAEGLSNSTHSKGEHSKGSLIHDNATEVLIVGNLYASNRERNPLVKGGGQAVIANNLIYNPGNRGIHYNLLGNEWEGQPYVTGILTVVGNVMRHGPDTPAGMPLITFRGDGDLEFFAEDNIAVDQTGKPVELVGTAMNPTGAYRRIATRAVWPEGFEALPAGEVQERVLRDAGARPWDRDAVDRRIVQEVDEGKGRVIDSEQEVGGYPVATATRRAFDPSEWDLDTMTRREPAHR